MNNSYSGNNERKDEMKGKNRVSVALSTENPPQIYCTKSVPM